jgi:hypothetical protein
MSTFYEGPNFLVDLAENVCQVLAKLVGEQTEGEKLAVLLSRDSR